ncbi:MAG TPA: D-cysteine desulfhydrase family protein [Thermohalobaculum sp.]|nr:D-cysteine desulfhydrase family protein [Thermohalobaculum sp.]
MIAGFGCLDDLPRAQLATEPTPLERLSNIEADIGGPQLYVKRDDAQPLAFGGNKVRQLEFYFGEALEQGADTVLITGAVQSNFCRLCAAFAAKLGFECHIQHEDRVPKNDPLYRESGNVLVARMLGATLHSYAQGEDEAGADARMGEIADELRAQGRKPYIIHLAPGHPPLGALGYVVAARELAGQLEAREIEPAGFVVASGSGATHAGFLFGLRALGIEAPVLGICVRRSAEMQKPRLLARCAEIATLLGVPNPVSEADVQVSDAFLAPGYGYLNPATTEAILTGASREALMLDPVYTGKAMAGFLDWARSGGPDEMLVFLHTGGTPGIFAYGNALAEECGW